MGLPAGPRRIKSRERSQRRRPSSAVPPACVCLLLHSIAQQHRRAAVSPHIPPGESLGSAGRTVNPGMVSGEPKEEHAAIDRKVWSPVICFRLQLARHQSHPAHHSSPARITRHSQQPLTSVARAEGVASTVSDVSAIRQHTCRNNAIASAIFRPRRYHRAPAPLD